MGAGFVVAVVLAFGFALTNGIHDASNASAALVTTRAARPRQAIVLAAVFNILGPVLVGAAVADTIGGIVTLSNGEAIAVIGAGLLAAVVWNLGTLVLGLPSSSGHALVGGLVGAALVEGGTSAIRWGGFDGIHPVGVIGTLVSLAVAPFLGAAAGVAVLRSLRSVARRATRRWRGATVKAEWVMASALAFSHGSNDAQKAVGVLAALLVADGRLSHLSAPLWAELSCAAALTVGTALGGWRIVRTVGRGIYRVRTIDGLASQSSSAGVILAASVVGAPVSTSQVVASSVVGVGAGRRRWHHVHWAMVREIGIGWLVTMPATALLAAAVVPVWRWAL